MRLRAEHEVFRRAVRGVIDSHIAPNVDEWEAAGGMPTRAILTTLADRGVLGTTLPASVGGLGLDMHYSYVWAQELGRVHTTAVAMSLLVQTEIVGPMLAEHGSQRVIDELLRPMLLGHTIAAVAVTEPGAGSDIGAIRTRIRHDGRQCIVSGEKAFVTHGSDADLVIALCRSGEGIGVDGLTLIAIPTSLPGVHQQEYVGKFGNRACKFGTIRFDDVPVPDDFTLGRTGLGYSLQTRHFVRERCFWAVVSCCWAQRVMADTLKRVTQRQILGRKLVERESIAFRLAELAAELEVVTHYADYAFEQLAQGKECLRSSAIAKLQATRAARRISEHAMQLHGAEAYLEDLQVARDLRDMRALSLAGGADEALLHLLSGFLLSSRDEHD